MENIQNGPNLENAVKLVEEVRNPEQERAQTQHRNTEAKIAGNRVRAKKQSIVTRNSAQSMAVGASGINMDLAAKRAVLASNSRRGIAPIQNQPMAENIARDFT